MNSYTTSDQGLKEIVGHEGEILHTYDDFDPQAKPIMPGDPVQGTLTIGVGHTGDAAYPGNAITKAQSRDLLRGDLQYAEQRVNTSVHRELKPHEFDMLVSHTFNTGGSETLFELVSNNAPIDEIREWWTTRYIWSKGVEMPGLVKRRKAEFEIFRDGYLKKK